jgi:hypothetical protein
MPQQHKEERNIPFSLEGHSQASELVHDLGVSDGCILLDFFISCNMPSPSSSPENPDKADRPGPHLVRDTRGGSSPGETQDHPKGHCQISLIDSILPMGELPSRKIASSRLRPQKPNSPLHKDQLLHFMGIIRDHCCYPQRLWRSTIQSAFIYDSSQEWHCLEAPHRHITICFVSLLNIKMECDLHT